MSDRDQSIMCSANDDERITALAPRAIKGDQTAIDELRVIYLRGNFDPGFGRELAALLGEDA